jgi:hypothetical protein|nr:MAG TPA: hypothetical protein [Bacteriophage sp.]
MKILNLFGNEKVFMNILYVMLGFILSYALIGCSGSAIVSKTDMSNMQNKIDSLETLNKKYYEYYKSVEQLLDEKLEEDDPILETDCGAKYLDSFVELRKAISRK